jgi:hypothetical protein
VLLRLAYLGVTNAFALLRLLAVSDGDKEAEILALRHQIAVLERQLGTTRPRLCPGGPREWRSPCSGSHSLGMLICRIEGVIVEHIYTCCGILTHALPALRATTVKRFHRADMKSGPCRVWPLTIAPVWCSQVHSYQPVLAWRREPREVPAIAMVAGDGRTR